MVQVTVAPEEVIDPATGPAVITGGVTSAAAAVVKVASEE